MSRRFFRPSIILIFCTLFLATTPNFLAAQSAISPEQFLILQLTDSEKLTTSSLTNKTFTPNWIENVEFRTETREFDIKQQRYLLRASPNSPKVRKAQEQLYDLYHKRAMLATSSFRERSVEEAYQRLINIYEHHHALQLKQEQLVLLKDQEIVLNKLSSINARYGEDWIDIIADIQELEIQLITHQSQLSYLLPNNQKIDWATWMPIEMISQNLQIESPFTSSTNEREWQLEQQLIDSEIALEEAEADRIFDFFQIEYQGRAEESFDDKVSLTASFQFPFSSSRKLKIEELLLEKALLEQEQQAKSQLVQQEIVRKKQQLVQQIQHWELTKNALTQLEEKSQQILKVLAYQTKEGPLSILVHQTLLKEKEEDILNIEVDIYEDYLDYLLLTNAIYQSPYQAFSSVK